MRPRVVVADSDASSLAAIRSGLDAHVDLATFEDPFDALIAIGASRPDVLVLDLDGDALDARRCLASLTSGEETSSMRCIAWSSRDATCLPSQAAGASAWVRKGDVSTLRAVVLDASYLPSL